MKNFLIVILLVLLWWSIFFILSWKTIGGVNNEKNIELEQQLSWSIIQLSWLQQENQLLKEILSGNTCATTSTDTSKSTLSTFSDTNIGFSFQYPNNGKIIIDNTSNPKRIQNYSSSNTALAAWDFYIEIFYWDWNSSCKDEMWSINSNYIIHGVNIARWYGVWWWDAWWTTHALCFQKWWKTIYIWYTENWSLYAKTIFDSLQLN